ncbi:MAG: enoyl-CoA hydratase/isomerase family protein [Nocardia sp.]|uniref:enoyl-CoA hydratase/isomerase family protein n=1 Tax=Nocardia sp. TaxID=1821 RepID=UPI002618E6F1|nr:enoyl-CoA hydratase/isomerase family protein [Nocardia sp.]MCU1647678.1 enoyl-CoA hydratase/isomerase family protein [Nocardia sp.]
MSDIVLTEVSDGVATLILNRPEQMNAISVELGARLHAELLTLAGAADVIVIRGSGGNFCVGGDFRELEHLRAQGRDAMAPLFANFRAACDVIATLPVPVVCAVEGYAMAGGFELMQAADIVLIHENAVVADTHARFGQIPGGGSSQRLPRLVGRQRALAHILTGDRLSADEVVAWGLAYRKLAADEFDSAVTEFARRLAAKDRAALAEIKHLVDAGLGLPLAQGLDLEFEAVLDHLSGATAGAGIASFTTDHGSK